VDQAPYFAYFGQDLGSWVRDHLDQPQVIIMGRATYVALAGFSASATDEVSVRMSALPKFVFSSTLKEPLAWKNTRLLKGAVAEELRALKQERGDPLRSIGPCKGQPVSTAPITPGFSATRKLRRHHFTEWAQTHG
jgi:dihydrofolate reductase